MEKWTNKNFEKEEIPANISDEASAPKPEEISAIELPHIESDEERLEKLKERFDGYQKVFHLSPEDLQKPILDVGAYDGAFVEYERTILGNTSAYGVEPFTSKIPPHTEGMVAADGFRLPFKDSQFEIVLARDYVPMFHPEDESSFAVEEMLRVANTGGYVKFTTTTPEQELLEKNNYKKEDGPWFDKRHIGAQNLYSYLDELKQQGYIVTEEKDENDRTVVTVHKKQTESLVSPETEFVQKPENEPQEIEDATASEQKNEGTPKEWREKLRGMVGRFTEGAKEKLGISERGEKLKENLESRSKELDAEAAKLGIVEKTFRSLGEKYNESNWKTKLAVGLSLGLGAGAFSLVSMPVAIMFLSGIAVQRTAGLASMFLKFEKNTQDGKWKKEKAMGKAIAYSAAMTGGMLLLVEGVKESGEWLKHYWSSVDAETAAATRAAVAHTEAAVPVPAQAPEMPTVSVEASHDGHGSEYMMKRLWEQLQDKHLDPSKYAADSDMHKLLTADANSIDKVVHQIAADPSHGFFNADGTSVQINPHDHLSIGTDGQVHLNNDVHASASAHTTPAYHPEHAAPAHGPDVPPPHTEQPMTSPESDVGKAETMAWLNENQTVVTDVSSLPPEYPVETLHVEAPQPPQMPQAFVNPNGIRMPLNAPHLYAGEGGRVLVYGGSPQQQFVQMQQYFGGYPNTPVIYSVNNLGYPSPWYHSWGRPVPGIPGMNPSRVLSASLKILNPLTPFRVLKIIK